MSKNNYKILLTTNSKMGHVGQSITTRKGFARYLYIQNKALPICRKSKIEEQFEKRVYAIIDSLKKITSLNVYKESKAFIIKKPVTVQYIIKEISKKINKPLNQLYFKLPSIVDYATYKLEVYYLSKVVHTIDIIVSNDEKD